MRNVWLPCLVLIAIAAFLASGGFAAILPLELPALRHLGSVAGIGRFLLTIAGWLAIRVVEFVPLGMASGWIAMRASARAVPALGLGLLIAITASFAAVAFRSGTATPTLVVLVLPWAGALVGLTLGVAFCARGRSRKFALVACLCVLIGPALTALLLGVLAVSSTPMLAEPGEIDAAQRRALIAQFRGRDPRHIAPGETRTVTLPAADVDRLIAWLASAGLRARASVNLHDGGFSGRIAVPIPKTTRWLNIAARSDVALVAQRLEVAHAELSMGAVSLPSSLVTLIVSSTLDELQSNPDLQTILGTLTGLSLDAEHASVSYGKLSAEPGLFARLVWGDEPEGALRADVLVYVDHILTAMAQAPAGDARFSAAQVAAFSRARSQTGQSSAVTENRHALVALGVVLGHSGLLRTVGGRLDDAQRARIDALRAETTLRSRADWTRHFAVSAALTVLADVSPSDAVGLLKEQLDADGGSGFSFGDLLADRAGTTLAERATRDEQAASTAQSRIAAGFAIADYFPDATGLVEGLPEAEFKARFGSAQDPRYRVVADEIERRVRSLPTL